MKTEIIYRKANRSDYGAILTLYNAMYMKGRELSDFEWLVDQNPYGKAILFIALRDEEVIGMQSMIPYEFIKAQSKVLTFKSEDSLIREEYRGMGIFSKLYELVHEEAAGRLVWGLTDKKAILERLRMPSSERLTIAVSTGKPSFFRDKIGLHRSLAKTILYSIFYFKAKWNKSNPITDLTLEEMELTTVNGDKIATFFNTLSKENPDMLFPAISLESLNWRLALNPSFDNFKVITSISNNGEIRIFSLIGITGKSAYWLSTSKLAVVSETDLSAHIHQVQKNLFGDEIELIHTWLFECNHVVRDINKVFLNSGFSKVRDGLWIVRNALDCPIDAHSIYFSAQLGIR